MASACCSMSCSRASGLFAQRTSPPRISSASFAKPSRSVPVLFPRSPAVSSLKKFQATSTTSSSKRCTKTPRAVMPLPRSCPKMSRATSEAFRSVLAPIPGAIARPSFFRAISSRSPPPLYSSSQSPASVSDSQCKPRAQNKRRAPRTRYPISWSTSLSFRVPIVRRAATIMPAIWSTSARNVLPRSSPASLSFGRTSSTCLAPPTASEASSIRPNLF